MPRSSSPDAAADGSTGLPPRQSAWRVLQAVAAGAWADVALERELARRPLPPLDRALATELVYGCVRQRRLLDAWIDALGAVPAARQPPQLRWLLHLGLYQLLFSQRVPAAAAVSTSVELAKRGGLARLAPVVNGLLRALLRRRAELPPAAEGPLPPWLGLAAAQPGAAGAPEGEAPDGADGNGNGNGDIDAKRLGLRQSLPDWLAADLLRWLPPERAEAFARAANTPPPLDLRVNRLRSSRKAVLAAFEAAGIAAVPLADLEYGLCLSERAGALTALPGYAEGHWCVQDRSAQRIAPLLAPRPGQRLLDACAAPGGKSSHLAELIDDRGEVLAVDRSEARLRRLQANAQRLGLSAIQPLATDAAGLAASRPDWHGRFDAVLLDAPCSGLGTLARHADARWRIDASDIANLSAGQRSLLDGVAPLLAPGGRLVYATCTVHPAENSAVVERFLEQQPHWHLQSSQQWWPGAAGGGDGFFAAVLIAPAG